MERRLDRLGECANTDNSVRSAVRAKIAELGAPFLIGEVWRPLGLPRTAVNRELTRMRKKGLLVRWPIPVTQRCHIPGRERDVETTAYLYALAEGYE